MVKPVALLPKPDPSSLVTPGVEWWRSPDREQLIQATTLIAGGQPLKAALLVRDVLRQMEDRSADKDELAPVLSLSAEAWRRTAARFATYSADYLTTTRQFMRVGFLAEARAAYMQVRDLENVVRMTRATADAYRVLKRYVAAARILEEALAVAVRHEALDVVEAHPFLKQLGEAHQAAFEAASARRYPAFLESGPKAAGYLYLTGDTPYTMAYLEKVADRYHQVAEVYHRLNRHAEAFATVLQASVLEVVLGREDAVAQRADQIVQYAILAGDQRALASYGRALRFAQNGSAAMAQAVIHEQARALIAGNANSLRALDAFHEAVDGGMDYVSRLAGNSFYGDHPDDEKALRELWINMGVAFRQGMAWVRSVEMLSPYRFSSLIRQFGRQGIRQLEYGDRVHTGNLTAASALYPSSPDYVRADPHLYLLLAQMGGGGELDMSTIALYLARQLNCTPAEVKAALTPYGDRRIVERMKAMTGEVIFAQLRQTLLTHHHKSLREEWPRYFETKK